MHLLGYVIYLVIAACAISSAPSPSISRRAIPGKPDIGRGSMFAVSHRMVTQRTPNAVWRVRFLDGDGARIRPRTFPAQEAHDLMRMAREDSLNLQSMEMQGRVGPPQVSTPERETYRFEAGGLTFIIHLIAGTNLTWDDITLEVTNLLALLGSPPPDTLLGAVFGRFYNYKAVFDDYATSQNWPNEDEDLQGFFWIEQTRVFSTTGSDGS